MTAIDVTSAEPILSYVPREDEDLDADELAARALSGNAVGRLAYVRALDEVGDRVGRPLDPADPDGPKHELPDPRTPDPDVVERVIEEMLASGRYAPVVVDTPKAALVKEAQALDIATSGKTKAELATAIAEAKVAGETTDPPPDQPADAAENAEA